MKVDNLQTEKSLSIISFNEKITKAKAYLWGGKDISLYYWYFSCLRLAFTYGNARARNMKILLPHMDTSSITERWAFQNVEIIPVLKKTASK